MRTKRNTGRPTTLSHDLHIVLVSDTHELHREIAVPDSNVFIHVGDFTMFSRSRSAFVDFDRWLGALPRRWKLVVPSNHECFFDAAPDPHHLLTNAKVLINESVRVAGLRIWGSPATPGFGPAFLMPNPADRRRLYAQIPNGTDMLDHSWSTLWGEHKFL